MAANKLAAMLNSELALQLPEQVSEEELINQLSIKINELIQTDFEQLVRLLYRIDVSEPKLKQLLKEYPDADAGKLIATMIVERQLQKQKSRQQFRQRDDMIPDEEKW